MLFSFIQAQQPPPPRRVAAEILGNVQEQTAQMRQAFMRLGLSDVAAAEFMDNSIINMNRLRALT
jgi:hypothetical protein